MADVTGRSVDAEVVDTQTRTLSPKPKRLSWSMLFAGVLFVILGIVCWVWPNLALATVAMILGVGFLVAGVANIVDYALGHGIFSIWLLVNGIFDVILGLIFVLNPLVSAWALTWIAGIVIIVSGIMQLVSCWRLRHDMVPAWWLSLLTGLVTIILGILMMAVPATLSVWISIFAIVYGVGLCVFAFRMPKLLA